MAFPRLYIDSVLKLGKSSAYFFIPIFWATGTKVFETFSPRANGLQICANTGHADGADNCPNGLVH
jgi:hypothetical protein